jgi:type IV pilus assembly protein PilY1
MANYCQMPSSIGTPVEPNVLFLIDLSVSMGYCAYTSVTGGTSCESASTPYSATTTYEGYFDPAKNYKPVDKTDGTTVCDPTTSTCLWIETTPTGDPCVTTCTSSKCQSSRFGDCTYAYPAKCSSKTKPYSCCQAYSQSGDCNVNTGNYLNYKYMRRLDVLKWALTGGQLESCDSDSPGKCNPEVYPNSLLSCDADGCILKATDGTTLVKARWERITGNNGGLLFQLKSLSPKPVIGAMFFEGAGVRKTVYIGDFTGSASYDGVNPYKNTVSAVNYEGIGGYTPTAPAMWDALNYLAQNSPKYGGPNPDTSLHGNPWKNPMYRCFDASGDGNCQGNEFELVPCAKNFVVLLSDGQWNMGGYPVGTTTKCRIDDDIEAESPDPVVPAYWMHKKGFTNQATDPQMSSYVESIYTVGLWLSGVGELALKNVAMYGSFNRINELPGGTTGYPQGQCGPVDTCCFYANCGKGSSCTALPSSHSDWDKNGDGIPDTYFKADNAVEIKERLIDIILEILRHVSSGSAVSILASSEGSGASLLQAVYFPRKSFGTTEIDWLGKMHNLWYYVDPYLASSNIREDTVPDKKLHLINDYVVQFYYNTTTGDTMVKKYQDVDGDGLPDTSVGEANLEDVNNLWEAGKVLWARDIASSARTLYTQLDGINFTDFTVANASGLQSYLQATSLTEAQDIINYILGQDKAGYRNRTVTIDGSSGVWRLGDIVNSTPRIQSFAPLNSYHLVRPNGYFDTTYSQFINQDSYKNRGMAYVGANDGMLHAFFLGNLKQNWSGKTAEERGWLQGTDLAKEVWAFIPKNTLPYLRYLPEEDYCHLYYVDASTFLVEASINGNATDGKTMNSWRTILIGGMGLGGSCRKTGDSCTNCIKTPITDPLDSSKGLGYSSYFALDVTDPDNPVFLWEFSDAQLGMSTTGPAIIRQGDSDKNGNWYVVFASGPTGPIDAYYRQFLGKSDQELRFFVLDLKTGTLLRKIDTGIANAFGGSLYNATIDTDRNDQYSAGFYKDDALYLGYTQCADSTPTTSSTWTKGGVLRLVTKEIANPDQWAVSAVVENIGPVTAAITKLQDRSSGKLWLYFGTGRYFYKMETNLDDPGDGSDSTKRKLYGILEPCYSSNDIDGSCSSSISTGILQDSSPDDIVSLAEGKTGWYIDLDIPGSGYLQERLTTDPLAVFSGVVFFTTFKPSSDICAVGGSTYIWAVNYNTGGASAALLGKALLQVSTGEIKELTLESAFTQKGGRRSAAITGVPPKGQGLSVLLAPKPLRKILQMQEK